MRYKWIFLSIFVSRRMTLQTGLNGPMLTMSKTLKRRNENLGIILAQMTVFWKWWTFNSRSVQYVLENVMFTRSSIEKWLPLPLLKKRHNICGHDIIIINSFFFIETWIAYRYMWIMKLKWKFPRTTVYTCIKLNNFTLMRVRYSYYVLK